MIDKFISKFTHKKIEYIKKANKFFLASDRLLKISKSIDYEFYAMGVFLGEEKNEKFHPSLALLNILSKMSNEKVFVNSIGELDFVYGKDLKKRHVTEIKGNTKSGFLKLVQNENDENLGYGKLCDGRVILKNRLDVGDFLRREKQQKVQRNKRNKK